MDKNVGGKLESRIKNCLITLLPFVVLYLLSKTVFDNIYLFNWTARNFYLFLWILAIAFAILGKMIYAKAISFGNIVGILIGQFFGDFLRNKNMAKITESMTEEQKYHLRSHKGVAIWLAIILISLILAYIITRKNKDIG
ncbi:MAG: hypothetical protein Q4P34_08415 [Tissierellia bacterium]|nr:hypothetical protein [Tissierellia bacterium]